jgi:hypothetical protein
MYIIFFIGELKGKRPLGRPRRRWKYSGVALGYGLDDRGFESW